MIRQINQGKLSVLAPGAHFQVHLPDRVKVIQIALSPTRRPPAAWLIPRGLSWNSRAAGSFSGN